MLEKFILDKISKEIEHKYKCKVLSIDFAQLLSLCVRFKIQVNDDFLYKPFEELGKPEAIVFSERSMTFYRRVDLFECIKNDAKLN